MALLETAPPSVSASGLTITSGNARAAAASFDDLGVPNVTSPTPDLIAAFAHSTAAPE